MILTKDEKEFKKKAAPVVDLFKESEPLTYSLADKVKGIKIAYYVIVFERCSVGKICPYCVRYTGRAGDQDYKKAAHYYDMADKEGDRQATENLGYIYYYGRT